MLSTDLLRAGLNAARYNVPMLFNLRDPNYGDEERDDLELFKSHPYVDSWADYSGPAKGHCHEYTGYGVFWMKHERATDAEGVHGTRWAFPSR